MSHATLRRRTARVGLATVLLLIAAGSARAQTPEVTRIDIEQYGIYDVGERIKTADPNAPGGRTEEPSEYRLTRQTTAVPAQSGTSFGLVYRVRGEPAGGEVTIREIVRFPPPGLYDPASGKSFASFEYDRVTKIGGGAFSTYGFDYDWELVPGPWTFEYWYGDRKLAEQTFTVALP